MVDNRFVAWTAFTLFALAVAVALVLVFSPLFERFDIISPEGALWVVGTLALLATVTGFVAFKTPQGKVAAIGGLLLLLAILFVTPVRSVIDVS
jgi:hypothetical protein